MKRIIYIITILLYSLQISAIPGDGSIDNPFIINNLTDFLHFRDTVNSGYYTACAELNSDIDLKEVCFEDSTTRELHPWFAIAGWGDGTSYQGRFDGKGHIIRNLYINSHIESNRGIFGSIANAVIINLGVENVFMIAGYNIGGITGTASNSIISNCFVSGHIEGYFLGGIIGIAENCIISNCYSNCFVDGNYPGYLVGYNLNSTLLHCFYNNNITCNGKTYEAIGITEEKLFNGYLSEKLNDYVQLHGGDSLLSWCHSVEEKSLPQFHCKTSYPTIQSEIETLYTSDNCLYFHLSKEKEIQIYDMVGRLLLSKKFPQGKHCITTLPKGNYIFSGKRINISP